MTAALYLCLQVSVWKYNAHAFRFRQHIMYEYNTQQTARHFSSSDALPNMFVCFLRLRDVGD